jgi:DNA-binding transcriptional MocR family regulator
MIGYRDIADALMELITKGVLHAGDRVPSIRGTTRKYRVSAGTVIRAYRDVEARGLIESRPRSGYFVREGATRQLAEPAPFKAAPESVGIQVIDQVFEVFNFVRRIKPVIHFGSAFMNPELFPAVQMNRAGAAAARGMKSAAIFEDFPPGNLHLRRLIARRYLDTGHVVSPEELVVTCGAIESISLSLQVLTRPGDTVAIETPSFYAILQEIEWLGLRAHEISTHPRHGVDLDSLESALKTGTIKACIFIPSFQNPIGSCMPEENRRALARLAEQYQVPVIEDDVCAELYFGPHRNRPVKSFDRAGWVLHCGSFSKCLAPGYRIGWVAAGRFAHEIRQRKIISSFSTAPVCQEALVRFLRQGGFEQHLRRLRHTLSLKCQEMMRAVASEFPSTCRMTRPEGGYMLWLELPESVDALKLHRLALGAGVGCAPGAIFSAQRRYQNCLRLNFGYPTSAQIAHGVRTLARLLPAATSRETASESAQLAS